MRVLGKAALACYSIPLLFSQTGVVEGSVSDSTSRAPLAAVTVSLSAKDAKDSVRTTVTGAAGAFRIDALQPGDYEAAFSKQGYFTRTSSAHIKTVEDAVRLDVALVPQGALTGRVLDSQRHPMANVPVRLSTASRVAHAIMLMMTQTDKDGSYHFQKLEPGAYMIEAVPIETNLRARGAGPLPPPEGDRLAWANTYYPGVLDRSQAARVVIHGGWELPGYDIALQAVPVYCVRGVVDGEDGKPAPRVSVTLDFADRWEHDNDVTKTRDDGTFEFPSVHQGEWRLTAMQTRPREETVRGFASISVARHDLENVQLRLASPFAVHGVVEVEGPPDPARKTGPVVVESATRAWSEAASGPDAGGAFRFDGIYPDRYTIGAPARVEGYYPASILIGDREVLNREVEMTPGMPPIRLRFKPATGRVTGTVENSGRATVVLLPKDETLLTYQFIRSVQCDASGRYQITEVRPGDYYAVAFTAPDLTALEDPDLVRTFLGITTAVQVENGVSTSVDLKLAPWPE